MPSFNLSLDDFSPHPQAGLNFEVIDVCNTLVDAYPEIKINLFVPAAYCRLGETPCFLTKNLEWVERVSQLPAENYRVNLHGYYHCRYSQKYGNSNNDEWQHLSIDEAKLTAKHMIDEFNAAGLDFVPTFRPPGWKASRGAIQALQFLGVNCFAGAKQFHTGVKDVVNVKWVNYNWDTVNKCKLHDEDVVAYGHTSSWTTNYMNEERLELILDLLDNEDFDFKFIEDM